MRATLASKYNAAVAANPQDVARYGKLMFDDAFKETIDEVGGRTANRLRQGRRHDDQDDATARGAVYRRERPRRTA